MSGMQPDQANFLLRNIHLPGLRKEHETTKSIFQAIPADKVDYRPDPVSKSAIDLAWHIASAEMLFLDVPPTGSFNLRPMPRPETITTSADLMPWYTENFESRLDKLAKVSEDQLLKVVDFRGLFQLPAVMYLSFILHHTIHHRGQLSTYLRPMGAKVPSIYGESYDTAGARKAAQQ